MKIFDSKLNENLPVFNEAILNFSNVLIDPEEDPLIIYESYFKPKNEKTKLYLETLSRMTLDKERLLKKSSNKWKYLKQLAFSKMRQAEIIGPTI